MKPTPSFSENRKEETGRRVALAGCADYRPETVAAALERLAAALDLPERFRSGERVLVKPNFLFPAGDDRPLTTHSEVILVCCRMLLDLGCRVALGDSPGWGSLAAVLERKGLVGPLKQLGVSVAEFSAVGEWPLPEGRIVKRLPLAAVLDDFDAVISLAKLKTHGQTYFTGSVKNLYGCLPGTIKPEYHLRFRESGQFARLLLDVHDAVRPRLGIMDGVIGMEGEGPSSGRPKAAGFLAASADCAALDIAAMREVGLAPERVEHLRERLAGPVFEVVRLGKIEAPSFEPPPGLKPLPAVIPLPGFLRRALRRLVVPFPVFAPPPVCRLCGECVRICPVRPRAVELAGGRPVLHRARCIQCYCCHEMCPARAISLSRLPLRRIWLGLKKG
ncbi:MAG TPA: DUF362 domain-containing protein [bacterium]|nr:DUF362 domain-containing protein [bacterium]